MKILVTGANGYLGQGIVRQLLDRGCHVIATDLQDDYIDSRAIIKKCDLFVIDDPYNYFEQPDVVVHLAWRDGFQHMSFIHMEDLPKHCRFVQKMIESGIKRFCGMGSMHEVGFYEGSIDEQTPTNPLSFYGISKNTFRQICQIMCKENNVLFQWIRGFYIVGNTERGCSIFSKITIAEQGGQAYFPFTSGDNQYDFLDYDEFCTQVIMVAMQEEVLGIINCCKGKPMRLGDRVEAFIRDNRYKIKLKYGSFQDRPYDSKAVWGNDEKIRKIMKR